MSKQAAAAALEKKADQIRTTSAHMCRKQVEALFRDSAIEDRSASFPRFDWTELSLGKLLGKGGFGTVYEVLAFDASSAPARKPPKSLSFRSSRSLSLRNTSAQLTEQDLEGDEEVQPGQMESRKFIAEHCIRQGGQARYAVKKLSDDVVKDPSRFVQGLMDMAIETRYLSNVEHPNIIKLRALAVCDPYEKGYFIVIDRLFDILDKRLKLWEKSLNRYTGFGRRLSDPQGLKLANLYEERIVAAFDLSSALNHLHQRQILYRDLKPENIGFNIRDDIILFDFGLAKELREEARNDDGTYNLTEETGSMRYMAPEIANSKPYNATCDSYSFAILLWQMLSCKEPYALYTPTSLRQKVYNGTHNRPLIDDSWSNAIKLLLKRSWDADLHKRHSMAQVEKILREECVRLRQGDDSGLEHTRRRSTFVFKQ